MQIYGPFRVSTTQPTAPQRIQPQTQTGAGEVKRSSTPIDQLDISSFGSAVNRLDASSPIAGGGEIRIDRVAEIRRQIAGGNYDTPDKLEAALDRFLDQIG